MECWRVGEMDTVNPWGNIEGLGDGSVDSFEGGHNVRIDWKRNGH